MADEVTHLLQEVRKGNKDVQNALYGLVYRELRAIAGRRFRYEQPGHTLQPTALVNEAYLRLVKQENDWKNRAHFYGVAAQVMRNILVDYARQRRAEKRGGSQVVMDFGNLMIVSTANLDQLIAIDEALRRLCNLDERQAQIVELRFFGGLTEVEVGEVLGISTRTVKREWSFARAWLHAELAL